MKTRISLNGKLFQPITLLNRLGLIAVKILVLMFSLSVVQFAQTAVEINPFKENANYKIGVGDVLKVIVTKQELLSIDGVRVSNEGTIRLPMLNESIPAACASESELASTITERYKKYLLNPQVYVAVKEFNANQVALVGSVITPGRIQLQRPMRLLELLTYANGPSLNAGKNIQIIRNSNAKQCAFTISANPAKESSDEALQEVISISLAETLKGNDSANPFIQPGDIINIAEAEQSSAYVIGSVRSAVAVNLKEPVTLSKALAMAGGVAPDAQIEKIKISRQQPNSLTKTELIVNLKEINKRTREDVLLQANDIVDVPGPSGTRKFLKDIFRTVVPVITRVPLIIP